MNNLDSPSKSETKPAGKIEYKVLIIDDDNWIERIISKYVEDLGFQAISADDPIVGIGMAVMQKPTVILLDIYMPELNGYTLLKILNLYYLTCLYCVKDQAGLQEINILKFPSKKYFSFGGINAISP